MMRTALEREEIAKIASASLPWEKLAGKTILVSGGTGFLGSLLLDVIRHRNEANGDKIHVVSLSRTPRESDDTVRYLAQDISREIAVEGQVDYILHLASNTHPRQYSADPVGTITTNVLGCYHLLELARKTGAARFLLASSVEIYGNGVGNPMREDFCGAIDCNTARAGYNEAKRVSESLCQSFRAQYGTEVVVARLARCFGADRKQDSKALSQFMGCALRGEDVVLKSAGKQRFSYCYAADAVYGLLKVLLEGKNGEAYNVSEDDEGLTLGDYATHIASLAGRRAVFCPSEEKGASVADYAVLDCNKLKSLGWSPMYSVREGLQRTYRILTECK